MNIKMKILYLLPFLLVALILHVEVQAQDDPEFEKEFEAQYQQRIKKSRINGVYIPKDIDDAFVELERLSHPEDLKKFARQPEEEVSRKLHFGLGKWMIVNWGFYEGSRFSHYLKEKGLTFPDDMAQVVLRLFHRHLNKVPIEEDALIAHYAEIRKKEREKILDEAETIEVRQRPREEK